MKFVVFWDVRVCGFGGNSFFLSQGSRTKCFGKIVESIGQESN
jgi:hypothetical protein